MTAVRVLLVVVVLLLVVVYAVLAARWTSDGSAWYRSLRRPRWQPPDVVFGVVWPLNFGAICVAGVAVTLEAPLRHVVLWLVLLAGSVALSLGWARTFYARRRLGRAAVLLAAATALTWGLVLMTFGLVTWAAWVLVPYGAWLTVATALAVGYWRLVPGPIVTAS